MTSYNVKRRDEFMNERRVVERVPKVTKSIKQQAAQLTSDRSVSPES